MASRDNRSSITIDIDKTDLKKLKVFAVDHGKSVHEVVSKLIQDVLNEPPVLNDETIHAMKEVVDRKDFVYANNADDLFDKLGV